MWEVAGARFSKTQCVDYRSGLMPPASVLVLRFSAVGDILLASPAIEALHRAWPETKIL